MPLILCHSPKGGVGTSFVAAGMAQGPMVEYQA